MASLLLVCTISLTAFRFLPPPVTAVQVQRRIEALVSWTSYEKRYVFVPMERISPHLRHAVVAAEDEGFYEHRGVDWQALDKAVRDNWRRGRLWRAGSTITQQLVKNLFFTTYLGVARKLLEIPAAFLAEVVLDKQRILELYLNVVEWGPGVYGAEAGAQFHYGVAAATLSRDQAARLAACLPSPRKRHPQTMHRLGAVIARRMAARGW